MAEDAGLSIQRRWVDAFGIETSAAQTPFAQATSVTIPPCDATSPPTVGSRSTKPAREVRLLLEMPLLFVVGRSWRSERYVPGSTPGEETAFADDPRRDVRFISAAAEVRVPSSALERRSTARTVAFDAIYPGSNPGAPTRSFGHRLTVGRESLELEMGVRIPRPDPSTETRLKAGHVFREHALAGSIPASPTTTRERTK